MLNLYQTITVAGGFRESLQSSFLVTPPAEPGSLEDIVSSEKKVSAPGRRVAPVALEEDSDFESSGRIEVSSIRDGGSLEILEPVSGDVEDELTQNVFAGFEDVLIVELDDGSKRWVSMDDVEQGKVLSRSLSATQEPDVIEIDSVLLGSSVRGQSLGLKAIERVGLSLATKAQVIAELKKRFKGKLESLRKDVLGAAAARIICEMREAKYVPIEGLFEIKDFSIDKEWIPPNAKVAKMPATSDKPALLLLHGTASSTDGAFAGLSEGDRYQRWQEIAEDGNRYSGVWAFNHRTLTKSPLHNVNLLLKSLPVGAKLHLISHSRGGLVGELLCVDPSAVDQTDFKTFNLDPNNPDAFDLELFRDDSEFQEYVELLKAKKPQVEKFVRVACPALGTTLASERLELYLSGFSNIVSYGLKGAGVAFPAVAGATATLARMVNFLSECATTLTSQKSKPGVLPGLASMMPTAPVIRFLNRPNRLASGDLTVVAADAHGSTSFFKGILEFVGDLFYLEEHDFVVPTRSMYGGLVRKGKMEYFLSEGPQSNHIRYFRNEDTFRAVLSGLRGEPFKFKPIESKQLEEKSWLQKFAHIFRDGDAKDERPVVFVLPGIMGSELSVDDEKIWLDKSKLTWQSAFVKKLSVASPGVKATGALKDYYHDLSEHLAKTHRVRIFPYDWRLSILDSGRELAKAVAEVAKTTSAPIRFICHSMGGLVVRAMMTHSIWTDIKGRKGCRIVMLGTPNRGSYGALKALAGQGGFLSSIDLLHLGDPNHNRNSILKTVHGFPGLLQMLPQTTKLVQEWDEIFHRYPEAAAISKPALATAQGFWNEIADTVDTERMIYVAGRGRHTPESIKRFRGLEFFVTSEGDGTVPWQRGKLDGVPSYHVRADHGSLPRHQDAFDGYTDLLMDGKTSNREVVFQKEPTYWFRDGFEQALPADTPFLFPTQKTLEATVMGVQTFGKKKLRAETKVQVRVVHGDLRYSKYPIVLGIYEEQPLESTQRVLDSLLDGRLSRDKALGVYPGPVGSYRYFVNENVERGCQNAGLLVGLGRFGSLTPGELTVTVRQGVLHYILQYPRCESEEKKPIGLSFVAIASMEGGIGLKGSLDSILTAVYQANRALIAQDPFSPTISHVDFVEAWDGRAITATHLLSRLCEDIKLAGHFKAEPRLQRIAGGQTQVGGDGRPSDWQRLDILNTAIDENTSQLSFKLLTDSARNQEIHLELESRFVDLYLRRTSANPRWQPELSQTLFELLIPTTLKEFADDGRPLLLQLNSFSAQYPWELLIDGMNEESEPISVRAKMVRQLSTLFHKDRPLNSLSSRALVVGDPPSHLQPLQAAQEEAAKVADSLRGANFEVESLIKPAGEMVISKLLAQPYRIIHLSGHGLYEPGDGDKKRTRAGMVLGEGLLLTPAILAQLRTCPELVFINCCHLGKIDGTETHFPSLAANLATEMIEAGAKAVVAAGWAVEDRCAELFATTFYRGMLAGETFGEAVLMARRTVYETYPQFNTWGAYQAYGDPDYRFYSLKSDGVGVIERNYVAPAEVLADLQNLQEQAKICFLPEFETLPDKAENIVRQIPGNWKGEPLFNTDVVVALARTYSELVHPLYGSEGHQTDDALKAALRYYELAEQTSALTVDDISIRLRLELLLQVHADKPSFKEIKNIIEKRKALISFSDNHKARSRVGGAAMTALSISNLNGTEKKELLKIMEEGYQKASHDDPSNSYYYDYYALSSLCQHWGEKPCELDELPMQGEDFFSVWGSGRRRLLRWLSAGAPEEGLQPVQQVLLESWKKGASPFAFKAVLELLGFLLAMRRHSLKKGQTEEQDAIYSRLKTLHDVAVGAVRGG